MTKSAKISVSLPPALVDDLDYIAGRLGVSRSALLAQLMADAVPQMRVLIEAVPPAPTAADLLRMRGQSEELVRQRVDGLKGMTNDLLSIK